MNCCTLISAHQKRVLHPHVSLPIKSRYGLSKLHEFEKVVTIKLAESNSVAKHPGYKHLKFFSGIFMVLQEI